MRSFVFVICAFMYFKQTFIHMGAIVWAFIKGRLSVSPPKLTQNAARKEEHVITSMKTEDDSNSAAPKDMAPGSDGSNKSAGV